jgi:hypothetical protein
MVLVPHLFDGRDLERGGNSVGNTESVREVWRLPRLGIPNFIQTSLHVVT